MYRVTYFGLQSLEAYNQTDEIGSGETPVAYLQLANGGALDRYGNQQKHPGAVPRMISRRLQASSLATLNDLYFRLLALRGKRDQLWRSTASGELHWIYARLVNVSAKRDYQLTQFKYIQDLDLQFVTQEACWHGDYIGAWYLNSGKYLNRGLSLDSGNNYPLTSSPTALTVSLGIVTDAGRAPVRAIVIAISAGDAEMSAISLERTGGEVLIFNGTIAANTQLIINTGTLQVLNDGVDAYNDLEISPTADMAAWFTLLPGDNLISVAFTGGGTGRQIDLAYYEAWY